MPPRSASTAGRSSGTGLLEHADPDLAGIDRVRSRRSGPTILSRSRPPPRGPLRSSAGAPATTRSRIVQAAWTRRTWRAASAASTGRRSDGRDRAGNAEVGRGRPLDRLDHDEVVRGQPGRVGRAELEAAGLGRDRRVARRGGAQGGRQRGAGRAPHGTSRASRRPRRRPSPCPAPRRSLIGAVGHGPRSCVERWPPEGSATSRAKRGHVAAVGAEGSRRGPRPRSRRRRRPPRSPGRGPAG